MTHAPPASPSFPPLYTPSIHPSIPSVNIGQKLNAIDPIPDRIRPRGISALRDKERVQVDAGLIGIGALQVWPDVGVAEHVAVAVGPVECGIAFAKRAAVQVDAVRGHVHADAFAKQAQPAGSVVVGHGAGAGEMMRVSWWC